jgi:hypothetical protein
MLGVRPGLGRARVRIIPKRDRLSYCGVSLEEDDCVKKFGGGY